MLLIGVKDILEEVHNTQVEIKSKMLKGVEVVVNKDRTRRVTHLYNSVNQQTSQSPDGWNE